MLATQDRHSIVDCTDRGTTARFTLLRSPVQSSLVNSPLQPQALDNQQPLPMRLSHFFVVVAAAFLATGALADTNVASVSEPIHRNLRKHHDTVEDEERGIIDRVPRDELESLARSVGVHLDDILNNGARTMKKMSKSQLEKWQAGLNAFKKVHKKPKSPRISDY